MVIAKIFPPCLQLCFSPYYTTPFLPKITVIPNHINSPVQKNYCLPTTTIFIPIETNEHQYQLSLCTYVYSVTILKIKNAVNIHVFKSAENKGKHNININIQKRHMYDICRTTSKFMFYFH